MVDLDAVRRSFAGCTDHALVEFSVGTVRSMVDEIERLRSVADELVEENNDLRDRSVGGFCDGYDAAVAAKAKGLW